MVDQIGFGSFFFVRKKQTIKKKTGLNLKKKKIPFAFKHFTVLLLKLFKLMPLKCMLQYYF